MVTIGSDRGTVQMASLMEVVRSRERELRSLRVEMGVGFDRHGAVVIEKRSLPDAEYELSFSDEEIAELRRIGQVTFTHNHPRGWQYDRTDPRHIGVSFSPDDVLLECRAELAEIRAVTPVLTFSLKPQLEDAWTERTWRSDIEPLYQIVYPELKERLYAAALRGQISPAEASVRLDHEVWTEVAQLLGLRYNRFEE